MLAARLYGLSAAGAKERCAELAEVFDLDALADRPVRTYSGGQRRRLEVALGIIHRPRVLFLDEPTTGLDPQNRANLREQLRLLRDGGTTIFLTTHYLDEADQLTDRVAIVDHGRVIALGRPDELKQRYSADTIAVTPEAGPDVLAAVARELADDPVHHECRGGGGGRGPGDDPADGHRRHPRDGRGLRRARVAAASRRGRRRSPGRRLTTSSCGRRDVRCATRGPSPAGADAAAEEVAA